MNKLKYDKLTIYEVEALKKHLLPIIQQQDEELVLDMTSVEKIDMSVIQLLVSAQKSSKKRGFCISLFGLKPSVEESLRISACHTLLGVACE